MDLVQPSMYIVIMVFNMCSWTVRNSSLMCYTSLMQRALGKKVKIASDHALTSREFFSRYPTLRPLLISQLTIATKDHIALHPSLYPSLLLLSRLKPMTEDISEETNDDSVKEMVPLVQQCVNNRHYMARTLAAKAIVPLVDNNKEFVTQIFKDLETCTSANKVHGLLCQLYRFVKESFEVEWFHALTRQLSNLTIKNRSHVSRTVFFKILTKMLRYIHALRESIDENVLSQIIDTTVLNSVHTDDANNVGTALMMAQAAQMVLQAHILHHDTSYMSRTIMLLITHQTYNVRIALHEFLIKHNMEWIHDIEYRNVRQAILQSVLVNEQDVNGIRYGLTAIHTLFTNEFSSDFASVGDTNVVWERLHSFFSGSNSYIKEQAIIVMGLLLRGGNASEKQITMWTNIISEQVQAQQTDNLRAACQKSIALSNALVNDDMIDAHICAWETCVLLLQDEDEDIRKSTAAMLSTIVSGNETKYELQVEYVLEACLAHMTQLFQGKERYVKFLLQFVSIHDQRGDLDLELVQIGEAPLFDKEPENIFVEKLFLAQLAALQLYNISATTAIDHTLLLEEMNILLEALEKKRNMYHVGDLTHHAILFSGAYRVALGLRAIRSPALKDVENNLLELSAKPNLVLLNVFNDQVPFQDLMFTLTQK
jgi:hypothetical protein